MNGQTHVFIVCSAIHYEDGAKHIHQPKNIETGIVVCGRRHHNCFATMTALRPNWYNEKHEHTTGFLTSDDRYVLREEAMEIAKAANQIRNKPVFSCQLFSEDLYP